MGKGPVLAKPEWARDLAHRPEDGLGEAAEVAKRPAWAKDLAHRPNRATERRSPNLHRELQQLDNLNDTMRDRSRALPSYVLASLLKIPLRFLCGLRVFAVQLSSCPALRQSNTAANGRTPRTTTGIRKRLPQCDQTHCAYIE